MNTDYDSAVVNHWLMWEPTQQPLKVKNKIYKVQASENKLLIEEAKHQYTVQLTLL